VNNSVGLLNPGSGIKRFRASSDTSNALCYGACGM